MMNVHLELGSDCLWVVTENPDVGQFDRRAFYPWDSDLLANEYADAVWLSEAHAHLDSISTGGEE